MINAKQNSLFEEDGFLLATILSDQLLWNIFQSKSGLEETDWGTINISEAVKEEENK